MNISEIFKLLSDRIQNEMLSARAALSHPGMKGAVTEQVVTDFLRKYLPPNLGLTSGVLVDSRGGVSKQLDIIVYDANKTPSLFLGGGLKVIPVECAYAAIEVKMQLTAENLQSCIENMESVKSLQRVAYYPQEHVTQSTTLHGIESDHWGETLYFVFAFEAKMSFEGIGAKLLEYAAKAEINKRIDSIYCLDLGYIANRKDGHINALPELNSEIVLINENSLLVFYACLSRYMNQAKIPNYSFVQYLNNLTIPVIGLKPT